VYSRAYIAFKTEELVAKFSREYDGHIFKDKAGLSFSPSLSDPTTQNVAICLDAPRERIASSGRVCSISKAGIGEEKGGQ
jgi:regulator of nonsense transcripts 3